MERGTVVGMNSCCIGLSESNTVCPTNDHWCFSTYHRVGFASPTSLVFVLALMASRSAVVTGQSLDWTFTCQREGNYNNDACKELDATLWKEAHECIADVTGKDVTQPGALPWQEDVSSPTADAVKVAGGGKKFRGRSRGLAHGARKQESPPSFFGGDFEDFANAAGMTESDAEDTHRRLQNCFSSSVNCKYWAYPNGICCRLNPTICASSSKNPCKRRERRTAEEASAYEKDDFDADEDDVDEEPTHSLVPVEYPYKAEVAAMRTECTSRLQTVCSELDQDKSGMSCLGSCESLKCGGYIIE